MIINDDGNDSQNTSNQTFFNVDEYRIKQKLMQLYSGDYVLVWGEPDEDG